MLCYTAVAEMWQLARPSRVHQVCRLLGDWELQTMRRQRSEYWRLLLGTMFASHYYFWRKNKDTFLEELSNSQNKTFYSFPISDKWTHQIFLVDVSYSIFFGDKPNYCWLKNEAFQSHAEDVKAVVNCRACTQWTILPTTSTQTFYFLQTSFNWDRLQSQNSHLGFKQFFLQSPTVYSLS